MRISKRQREEAMQLYREGGEAVGRLLTYHPEDEPRIWLLVAGTGVWKRWHLRAFKSIWRLENPQEYQRVKDSRRVKARSKRTWDGRMEATREASLEAVLKKTDP
jgi:ornithine cyclodeaminase/alanine dehydrogenase-like protein (mu-crystallin family)